MHIYVQKVSIIFFYTILVFLVFTLFLYYTNNHHVCLARTIASILLVLAIYGITAYTVLGRTPSDSHAFVFAAPRGNEFYREMFMNALLYYPLGLSLTVLIGPWSILIAFLSSMLIESWQYFAGTGLAQGTDVIMNTLGAAIGALPLLIVREIVKRQERQESNREKP